MAARHRQGGKRLWLTTRDQMSRTTNFLSFAKKTVIGRFTVIFSQPAIRRRAIIDCFCRFSECYVVAEICERLLALDSSSITDGASCDVARRGAHNWLNL